MLYLIWGGRSYISIYKTQNGRYDVPEVSTVLLNWNRMHLLKKTIHSYIDTISVPFELIIIDNGSTDGSKGIIKKLCKNNPNCNSIFLPGNRGGRALNLGLKMAKAKLLHVSENDLTYKSGWDQKMLRAFRKIPKLGQLSLFAPFKKENTTKVVEGDCVIYIMNSNVGTSSMFRREIWDKGIRWDNIGSGYKFPNDYAFSKAVKEVGYLVARPDETVVINHGHQIDEYKRNISYYIENYRSKPWLGIQCLRNRLQRAGYKLVKNNSTQSGYDIVPIKKNK